MDADLPVFLLKKITRALLEKRANRRVAVIFGTVRFVVDRANRGTYVIERPDGVLFDGRTPAKTAIGTKELKHFLRRSAMHDTAASVRSVVIDKANPDLKEIPNER